MISIVSNWEFWVVGFIYKGALHLYEDMAFFFSYSVFFEAANFVGGPNGITGVDIEAVAMVGTVDAAPVKIALG